jgi:hypothetical protein
MNIETIVDKALRNGVLTPAMEADISRLCESNPALSEDDQLALDRLMGALLTEQITTIPRKQFINMEELVLSEALARLVVVEAEQGVTLDLSDIVSFALNRLPPLYATTQEGAGFQRNRAQSQMQALIAQKVTEAIARYQNQPAFYPERAVIGTTSGQDALNQISGLLQTYASADLSTEQPPAMTLAPEVVDEAFKLALAP